MASERTYLLGPLERRSLIAGWRVGQVVAVGVACVGAGGVLWISTSFAALGAVVVIIALGLFAASWPVRGRTIDEWVPAFWAHLRRRGRRQLLNVEIRDGADFGIDGGIGMVLTRTGEISITMALDSTGIALLDPAARDRRVAGLIEALEVLAREGAIVDRVAWCAWSAPEPIGGFSSDLRRRGSQGDPWALENYRDLLAEVCHEGLSRRVTLTLRSAKGSSASARNRLVEEARLVASALENSGHRPCRFLGADELQDVISGRLGGAMPPGSDGSSLEIWARSSLRFIESDRQKSISWWIEGWPRQEASAELLAPLLLGSLGRSMAVVFEPIAPSIALRKAASARTSREADAELRRRGGFLVDRRSQAQASHLAEREAELVDGHGSLRLCGYLAVSSRDSGELGNLAAETELAAAQAHLALRRLDGDHGRGLLAVMPLGGGLP